MRLGGGLGDGWVFAMRLMVGWLADGAGGSFRGLEVLVRDAS